ncbi:MAG: hypothetical protein ABMA00_15110 [Gemmatimonas sp.]
MARNLAARELTPPRSVGTLDGFALATPDDDAELRALLHRVVIPGAVRVAFTREPDYFAGEGLAGATDRTLLHRADGRVNGIARLSTHSLHRNGTPRRIGYLGELRVASDARQSARLLRHGYAILRESVRSDDTTGCFTSIATDNTRARRVLEGGGRFGLPAYTSIADLVTQLVPVGTVTPRGNDGATDSTAIDRDELTDFLVHHARASQLSPDWSNALWDALASHGLHASDFRIVREHGRIVAAAAVWDQRSFRQSVVCGYEGVLRMSRPFVNLIARAGFAPHLPPPGSVLALGSVFGAAVDSDAHWIPLWNALRAEGLRRSLDWLAIARETRDPQLAALRRHIGGREYHTKLYDVRWPDVASWLDPWDARPFRPEVALL